jgi:hypothetical protein
VARETRISNMEKKGKEKNKEDGKVQTIYVHGQRGVGRIEQRRPVTQSTTLARTRVETYSRVSVDGRILPLPGHKAKL